MQVSLSLKTAVSSRTVVPPTSKVVLQHIAHRFPLSLPTSHDLNNLFDECIMFSL